MERISYAFADGVVIAKRNVIKIKRVPEILVSVVISPIIFVLLFAYVFGSSIDIPGGSYREFLISGIFATTLALRFDLYRGRSSRRHAERHHRSIPVVAYVTFDGRVRKNSQRRDLQRSLADHHGSGGIRCWMANPQRNRKCSPRIWSAAAVRIRLFLDYGLCRTTRSQRRSHQQCVNHGDLSAHLHRQHLRSGRESANTIASLC